MYLLSIFRFALRERVAHLQLNLIFFNIVDVNAWYTAQGDRSCSVSMIWTHTIDKLQHQLEYHFRIGIGTRLYSYILGSVISWSILNLFFIFIFGVLTPLSAIFQLYHGDQFLWWKKAEYSERTTHHGQATGKLFHLRLRVEFPLCCNLQSWAWTSAVLVIGLHVSLRRL